MTATKQFIEDAIEGGYEKERFLVNEYHSVNIDQALLDPQAWQAVGKTRGWEQEDGHCSNIHHAVFVGEDGSRIYCPECPSDEWPIKQVELITELQKGKSIEEALTKLT